MKARIGIVTVSDRASAGVYEDLSGKAIIDTMTDYLISEWEPVYADHLVSTDGFPVATFPFGTYLVSVTLI